MPSVLFLTALTGCSVTETRTEYRVWTPPDHLLEDCPVTLWTGGDWADVVDLAEARRADLKHCNTHKRALRKSMEAAKKVWGNKDPE